MLASAVTGAVLYEPDGRLKTFNVDWVTDTTSLDPKTASLGANGGSETLEFEVPVRNVTTGTFRAVLSAGDGHVNQDELTVNVTAPGGQTQEDSTTLAAGSSSTSLEVAVDVATIPKVSNVEAVNDSAALEKLTEDHASTNGTGTWTVEVTVNHGGTGITGTHEVEVTPTIGHYSAEVTRAGPDVRAP